MLESTHFNRLSRDRGDPYRFFLVDWERAPECTELRLWLRRMRSSLDWLKYGYRLEQLSRAYDHAVCSVQCPAVGEWLPARPAYCGAWSLSAARLAAHLRQLLLRRAPSVSLWRCLWRVCRLPQSLTRLAPLMRTLIYRLLSLAPLVGALLQRLLLATWSRAPPVTWELVLFGICQGASNAAAHR